jgi:hypothetical protein
MWGIVRKRTRIQIPAIANGPQIAEQMPAPSAAPLGIRLCWGLMMVGGLVAIAIPIVMMFATGPRLFPTIYFSLIVGMLAIARGAAGETRWLRRTAALQLANIIAFDAANVVLAAMEYALLRSPRVAEYLRAANATTRSQLRII